MRADVSSQSPEIDADDSTGLGRQAERSAHASPCEQQEEASPEIDTDDSIALGSLEGDQVAVGCWVCGVGSSVGVEHPREWLVSLGSDHHRLKRHVLRPCCGSDLHIQKAEGFALVFLGVIPLK